MSVVGQLTGAARPTVAHLALPYDSWDPEADLMLLRSGDEDSLGALWEATPVSTELAAAEAMGELAKDLASLFRKIPQGTCLQVILTARPTEGREIRRWLEGAAADAGILKDMAQRRAGFLQSFFFESGPVLYFGKDLRVFFTLRSAPVPVPRVFKDPQGATEAVYLAARAEFLSGIEDVEGAARALGLRLRKLGHEEAFGLLWKMLNPARSVTGRETAPKAHAEAPLAGQLLSSAVERDFERGLLSIEGVHHRVLSAYLLPPETQAGQLTMETLAGTLRLAIADLVPLGHVTISLIKPDQETLKTKLAAKHLLASAQTRISAGARHIARDARELADFLAGGHDAYQAYVNWTLGAQDPEILGRRVRELRAALEASGFSIAVEDAYAEVAFARSLPLGASATDEDDTQRAVTLTDVSAAHVSPLWSGFGGTRTPDHLLMDRRGRLVTFSLFDTPTRVGHTEIIAPTGSGKSVMVKTLMADVLRKGGYVVVLNKHTLQDLETNDYYRFARLLGPLGHFVPFDVASPPDLDVCAGPYSADMNLFLTNLICEIVRLGNPHHALAPKEINTVSEKIADAWKFYGKRGKRVKLSDIRSMMAGSGSPIAQDLGQSLAMFTKGGPYAGFFDGDRESLVPPGARFICYEMNQLADHKEVLTPLALMLFHQATRFFESLPTDVPKLLVIEEAWMLLESSQTSDYVAKRQRTYRKLRGAIVIVSQHARDLDSPAGRAILGDHVNLILLRHQAQEAADTADFLKLTPEQHAALRSLSSCPGYFSELLVLTPHAEGVARLVLGPHTYWLLTSDGRDLATIEKERKELARARGREPELMELVEHLAAKYPYGRTEESQGAA